MDDQAFRRLLIHMGLDWAGYRKVRKGVKKRLSRHMQELGCRRVPEYLAALDTDAGIRRECERRLTVAVSRFFRDRRLWDRIGQLLPLDAADVHRPLQRIWCAGCAGGEEVYSIKILEAQSRPAAGDGAALSILATDINPENLKRARAGAYPTSSLKELPDLLVDTCFYSQRGGRRFVVRPFLTAGIEWRRHDLRTPPPQRDFDAVFLRNSLLTYYEEETQKRSLSGILARLLPGGFLVVGSHERLPDGFGFMCRDPAHPLIWWKTADERLVGGDAI